MSDIRMNHSEDMGISKSVHQMLNTESDFISKVVITVLKSIAIAVCTGTIFDISYL